MKTLTTTAGHAGARAVATRRRAPRFARTLRRAVGFALAAWGTGAAAFASPVIDSRRAAVAPILDGRLDDAVWAGLPAITRFRTFHPEPGREPSQATELRIAHDARRLYLAYRCHDSSPESIRGRLAERDRAADDDWVAIVLDADGAGRGAAELLVNPRGCQLDAWVPGDGSGDRFEVDYRFQSAARRDSAGWTAELAVPFASLPSCAPDSCTMTFFALRQISRSGERCAFPALDLADQRWLSRGARVRFAGISPGRALEILPAFTCAWHGERIAAVALAGGDPLAEGRRGGARAAWRSDAAAPEIGCSVRWVPSDQLTLQCAGNPDFSQVEADARQVRVNRRFPLFYAEKRPFFLESREVFALAAEGDPLVAAFHSRSIVDPRVGVQLAARSPAGHLLGVLAAQDDLAAGAGAEDGPKRAEVLVLRPRWQASRRVALGAHGSARRTGRAWSGAAGLDGDLLLSDRTRLACHALYSRRGGPAAAGGGLVPLPESGGHAATLELERRGVGRTARLAYRQISPAFDPPAGFVTQRDLRCAEGEIEQRFFPRAVLPGGVRLNRVVALTRASGGWDFAGRRTDEAVRWAVVLEGTDGWSAAVTRVLAREVYLGREYDAGSWRIQGQGAAGGALRATASVAWRRTPCYDAEDPAQGLARDISAALTLRPAASWDLTAEWSAERLRRERSRRMEYDAGLARARVQWQPSRRLRLRALVEWDGFAGEILTDALASFTWSPGTVAHLGWGSLYRDGAEFEGESASGPRRRETRRAVFLKLAYAVRP